MFADSAGKKGGEFYTPGEVVQLLVKLLKPEAGMRVYDPTVGSGGMLVQTRNYLAANGEDMTNLSLAGQEMNLNTWAICKMNMFLHGVFNADIRKGDTLRDPQHTEDGQLITFDRVIANPPFSLKGWGMEEAESDEYGHFPYGVTPKGASIPACLLIVNKKKPKARKGNVLFINGELEFEEGKNQNSLRAQVIDKITEIFDAFKEIKRYARMVSIDDTGAR